MRRILVALGLVVAVVAVVWWLRGRGDDRAKPAAAKTQAGEHGARTQGPREPAKPARVSGRVTRKSDGSGVPGAVVSLAWAELGADISPTKMPTIVVTSDATGAWTADHVPPGEYVLAATATSLLPSSRAKLTLASAEQRGGIDFVLDAGGTLVRGTVSDVGGGPIESARVTARRDTWSLTPGAELVTLTGADGTYQLTLPDASYRLTAAHDDYTSATEPAEVAGTPLTVDFTLIPGGIVRGQVVARDSGKPVPGALVEVEGGRRMRGVGGSKSAVADADGQFVLRGLASGAMSIEARGRGYASAQPTVVQLGIGEEVDGIQVLVDGAYSIRGRVVEKGTTKGIGGARLGAFSMSAGARGESLEPSAEDGAFEIPGLRPGSYMLYAGAEGTLLEIGHNVEIVDHDVDDVIVEVGRGVTITGRVEPPTVATVTLELEAEVGLGNMFDMVKAAMCRTESDATGAFTLANAPPGKFRIVGAAKDGRTGKTPITIADVDQPGIVVQLTPRASIAGRVIDTNGKPVADISVNANRRDDRPMKFSMSGMRDNDKTRADGTFEIVGLDAGTYEVHARLPGDLGFEFARKSKDGKDDKADKDKSRATIELAEGAKRTGVTLTVEALDGVIRGQVMGPDHKPAADAWVTARREEKLPDGVPENMRSRLSWLSDSEPVLTNADGQFVIRKLRKGTYTLVADGPRGASHGEKTGVETGDSATIQLASLGTLALAVTQGGKPVPQ
ncbi:MAG TPA: carboxypeptidase-like regulatory domain-containing protein, partial [Acidimicrobiales bacterium]